MLSTSSIVSSVDEVQSEYFKKSLLSIEENEILKRFQISNIEKFLTIKIKSDEPLKDDYIKLIQNNNYDKNVYDSFLSDALKRAYKNPSSENTNLVNIIVEEYNKSPYRETPLDISIKINKFETKGHSRELETYKIVDIDYLNFLLKTNVLSEESKIRTIKRLYDMIGEERSQNKKCTSQERDLSRDSLTKGIEFLIKSLEDTTDLKLKLSKNRYGFTTAFKNEDELNALKKIDNIILDYTTNKDFNSWIDLENFEGDKKSSEYKSLFYKVRTIGRIEDCKNQIEYNTNLIAQKIEFLIKHMKDNNIEFSEKIPDSLNKLLIEETKTEREYVKLHEEKLIVLNKELDRINDVIETFDKNSPELESFINEYEYSF